MWLMLGLILDSFLSLFVPFCCLSISLCPRFKCPIRTTHASSSLHFPNVPHSPLLLYTQRPHHQQRLPLLLPTTTVDHTLGGGPQAHGVVVGGGGEEVRVRGAEGHGGDDAAVAAAMVACVCVT